jgi:large subunit ribosomal protein L2
MKNLSNSLTNNSGRNNRGVITLRSRGGGVDHRYRRVQFNRCESLGLVGKIVSIERDPVRNTFISLVAYQNGSFSYILTPNGIRLGDLVTTGVQPAMNFGNSLPLGLVPIGAFVHSVPKELNSKGLFARSAGASCQVLRHFKGYTELKLPSGKSYFVNSDVFVSLGTLSNNQFKFISKYKAGQNRWLGLRPVVRGVAKNPVDHPHGGGEGKSSGGRCSTSPWGWLTKGYKTRSVVKRRRFKDLQEKFSF